MPKPTTWIVRNAVPTTNAKAKLPTDNAITVTGDSIVKNGKPSDGKTINLTLAHIASPGFSFAYDEAAKTVTITRTEGSRGRKPRKATSAADLTAFLASHSAS